MPGPPNHICFCTAETLRLTECCAPANRERLADPDMGNVTAARAEAARASEVAAAAAETQLQKLSAALVAERLQATHMLQGVVSLALMAEEELGKVRVPCCRDWSRDAEPVTAPVRTRCLCCVQAHACATAADAAGIPAAGCSSPVPRL